MAKRKKELSLEEKLEQALVPADEQPYEVPENWCWGKLKNFTEIITGKKDANYGKDGGEYFFFTCASEPIKCPDYSFDCSAILLAGNGDISNISRYDGKFEAYQRTYVVQTKENMNRDYLYFYFKYRWVDYNIDKMFGTAIPYIRLGNLNEFQVPIAPIEEQKRIVKVIESMFAKLDEAKEIAEEIKMSSEDKIEAILHDAFTGKLTDIWRKQNDIDRETWEERELDVDFDITGGIQKTPARNPKDNPIPYITVANVYRDELDLSEVRYFEELEGDREKYQLKDKDILIVEGNGSGKEIGRCAMWRGEIPVCLHQNHIIRIRCKTENALPEYVIRYLNSYAGKAIMKEKAKTTAGLFNLSTGKIRGITVPYASINEQEEIVKIINKLIEKELKSKELVDEVIENIELMKESILAKAFHGELGTNIASEESSIELLKQILEVS